MSVRLTEYFGRSRTLAAVAVAVLVRSSGEIAVVVRLALRSATATHWLKVRRKETR
jgi:hypothetical protein